MEEAIKRAIKVGYPKDRAHFIVVPHDPDDVHVADIMTRIARMEWVWPRITQDPLFWQCLSKHEKWADIERGTTLYFYVDDRYESAWHFHMHRYFDFMTWPGSTIKDFFNDLLK